MNVGEQLAKEYAGSYREVHLDQSAVAEGFKKIAEAERLDDQERTKINDETWRRLKDKQFN